MRDNETINLLLTQARSYIFIVNALKDSGIEYKHYCHYLKQAEKCCNMVREIRRDYTTLKFVFKKAA